MVPKKSQLYCFTNLIANEPSTLAKTSFVSEEVNHPYYSIICKIWHIALLMDLKNMQDTKPQEKYPLFFFLISKLSFKEF